MWTTFQKNDLLIYLYKQLCLLLLKSLQDRFLKCKILGLEIHYKCCAARLQNCIVLIADAHFRVDRLGILPLKLNDEFLTPCTSIKLLYISNGFTSSSTFDAKILNQVFLELWHVVSGHPNYVC